MTALTSPGSTPRDAVAYHRELAADWEQRYAKPAFQARLRVFRQCLEGRDLRRQCWLDAGCGSGTLARHLAQCGAHVLGVDAAEEMIAAAKALALHNNNSQQLRFEQIATIEQLPLDDRSLDGIVCSSVLEYVSDPHACLAEFARVLKPGGWLVVSVANKNSLVRRAQIWSHHLGALLGRRWCAFLEYSRHDYSVPSFEKLLHEHGFSTKRVVPFGSPIPQWLQRREVGGSLLAFCAERE